VAYPSPVKKPGTQESASPNPQMVNDMHDLPLHLVSRSDDRELARSDGLLRG